MSITTRQSATSNNYPIQISLIGATAATETASNHTNIKRYLSTYPISFQILSSIHQFIIKFYQFRPANPISITLSQITIAPSSTQQLPPTLTAASGFITTSNCNLNLVYIYYVLWHENLNIFIYVSVLVMNLMNFLYDIN